MGKVFTVVQDYVKARIEEACARESPEVFEHLGLVPHLEDCLNWLPRINPSQSLDDAVKIAAFSHDIERAFTDRVKRADFGDDNDAYKKAHALKSADTIKEVMEGIPADPAMVDYVYFMIQHHDSRTKWAGRTAAETLGLNLVKSADTLSFFYVNFDLYLDAHSCREVFDKMEFMTRKVCGRSMADKAAGRSQHIDGWTQPEVRPSIYLLQRATETHLEPRYFRCLGKLEERARATDPEFYAGLQAKR